MKTETFQKIVWQYANQYGRKHLPWREQPTPYRVLVSELMLQQTQVERVLPKFEAFMARFPNIEALAGAPLAEVLIAWQGLGYNRRAKYLHEAAEAIVAQGHFPASVAELTMMRGIGTNTAGAICAYAFNLPVVYIETNIRTVFLYHYFSGKTAVADAELLVLVGQTLDTERPRDWYGALMDYGTYLKAQGLGAVSSSKQYKKQSAFRGSIREVRGQVIRELLNSPKTLAELQEAVTDKRLVFILDKLTVEAMVTKRHGRYMLPS